MSFAQEWNELVKEMIAEAEALQTAKPEDFRYPTNWDARERLYNEDLRLTAWYGASGSLFATLTVFVSLLASALLFPMGLILRRLQKINQILPILDSLLENFEEYGVEIINDVNVPNLSSLDLFVRFPYRNLFAIALRSQGDSVITYNEEKESFYIRRNKGSKGLKPWTPDHLQQLSDQEYWLRKNQSALFGSTSKQRRQPVVKVLVLKGQTKLGQHPKKLYTTVGDVRVLLIKKKASIYVMEEDQLINFIKGWISQPHATTNNG